MNIHRNTIFLFSHRVDESPCEELYEKPLAQTRSQDMIHTCCALALAMMFIR